MAGARTGQNLFLLNGAPISDTNGTWQLAPNVEAVQEFKVMTNTYDSSYGRFGGGVVNTTLNRVRTIGGAMYSTTSATPPSTQTSSRTTRQTSQNPSTISINTAGLFGGPIRKDKDFLFTSFEGGTERIGFPSFQSVPPELLRDGQNFSALGITIYDPMTTHRCGDKPGETTAFCTLNGARRALSYAIRSLETSSRPTGSVPSGRNSSLSIRSRAADWRCG